MAKPMTIVNLLRALNKMHDAGHRRCKVLVDKSTFNHPCESDGAMLLEVKRIEVVTHNILDDDGGIAETKDGREITKTSIVLKGE